MRDPAPDGTATMRTANDQSLRARRLREGWQTLVLSGPIIANNLSIAGMGLTDTIMAGRLSAEDLAGVAIGNAVWIATFLFGLGTIMAVSPMTAQLVGAGRERKVGRYLRQSFWLGQALVIAVGIAIVIFASLLDEIGIDPEVIPKSRGYLTGMAVGLPAANAYLCLRFVSEGLGHTRPIMYMAILGLVLNVPFNYVLMYGKLGFPALGATGCGLATGIANWIILIAMIVYMHRRRGFYSRFELFRRPEKPDAAIQKEIIGVGVPIGLGLIAEVGLFAAGALLMGKLGTNAAGAHAIAINYASTMFMIPLGIHSGIMIRVGIRAGAGDRAGVRFSGFTGIIMCGGFMTLSALVMIVFREPIIGLYTNDPEVAEIAVALLGMAALFQVADGINIGATGALRGLKDTRVLLYLNIIAFWVIAFPFSYITAIRMQLGPVWVWAGMAVGLFVGAALLLSRFAWITRPGTSETLKSEADGDTLQPDPTSYT